MKNRDGENTLAKILVVYCSRYGHIDQMAYAQVGGARRAPGTEVTAKHVPELAPPDIAKSSGFKLDQPAPIAEPEEMEGYDALMFGTPNPPR